MATLKVIFIVIEVLLLFNLLIAVHEFGHFLAAKWRGLKIDRFAIWFGKPIWKKKIGGVEYALGTIPAGGYVALPQMATMEAIEGKSETPADKLPPISALDKIIVAVAGPLFSFLLAVFFAVIIWVVGKPEQGIDDDSTTLGWVVPDGPAFNAGLRPGDKILSIDGHPVRTFSPTSQDSVTWRIITSENPTIEIKYDRDEKEATAFLTPTNPPTKWYERKSLRKILISSAYPAIVDDVMTNSPAARAGLRKNDEIVGLDGGKVYAPDAVFYAEEMATNHPNTPVMLTIRRDNKEFKQSLVPERPIQPQDADPSLGIIWAINTNESLSHPSPVQQISDSAGMILATIGAVSSPKVHVGVQQLGGPVMIIRAYKSFFESQNGWRRVLWFSVVLNVNLALLNMVPFPVLDGGHILLAMIEAIRRRPVSAKILQMVQTVCAVLLIGFIAYTMFFDTGDWISSAKKEHQADQTIIFAPK